jgi:hypothetical protein
MRFGVAGAWALGCSSSDHVCTDIGCISDIAPSVSVTGTAGGALPPGMYEIRVTTEAGASGVTCDRTDPASPKSCVSKSPTLQVPDSDIVEITISGDPKTIRVYVSINGTEVAARSFTAKYADVEVNGPGCGTCRNITVTPDPKIEL